MDVLFLHHYLSFPRRQTSPTTRSALKNLGRKELLLLLPPICKFCFVLANYVSYICIFLCHRRKIERYVYDIDIWTVKRKEKKEKTEKAIYDCMMIN